MGLADFATVKKRDAESFPGPGQYALKSTFGDTSGRVPTFKHRHKDSPRTGSTNEKVGPGSYKVAAPFGADAPKFSLSGPHSANGGFGATSQTDLGPAYSPRQYNMAESPSTPRFSIAARHATGAKPDASGPGPASIVLPSTLSKNGVTLGVKCESSLAPKTDNPGPGNYDVPRFGDKPPIPRTAVESHGVAAEHAAKPNPGPGAYNVNQHTIEAKVTPRQHEANRKQPLFGSKARPPDAAPCGAPGPAAYDIPSDFSPSSARAKGKSIGQRHVPSSELDSIYPKPGPAEYKLPSPFENTKNKGFSLSSRIPELKPRVQVPGPGAYSAVQYSFAEELIKSPRGVKFNANHKFNDGSAISPRVPRSDTQAPGPGHYEPKPIVPRPPAFTMTPRDNRGDIFADTTNAPGPGAYNPVPPSNSAGFTFYKGYFAPPQAPSGSAPAGPGAYDVRGSFEATHGHRATSFATHSPPPSPRRRQS